MKSYKSFSRPVIGLLFLGYISLGFSAQVPDQPWFPKAPTLSMAAGEVVPVKTVDELVKAVRRAKPKTTILLADGVYELPGFLELHQDHLTLRGASGNRHKVILDGGRSRHGELIGLKGSNITVAHLTIQNVKWNGIKIMEFGTHQALVYDCVLHNIWQRGVKASHIPPAKSELHPREGKVQYCLFYNDRPKAFSDDETDTGKTYNGNYIGGIDVKNTVGWTISDNVFVGIQGRTREGRGAIYISEEGRDFTIERNIFIDCDIGIALGNPSRGGDWMHCINGVVRNNFVTRCPETGILACYTENCKIEKNTVHNPESRLRRLIYLQFDNKNLKVAHNLLSGPAINNTSRIPVQLEANAVYPNLASAFVDAGNGNLSLRPGATKYPGATMSFAAGTLEKTALQAVPDWVDAMKKVHAGFKGTPGYVAQFGDSITYSMAFWSVMGWADPAPYLTEPDGLAKEPVNRKWKNVISGARDKGGKNGNYSGWKTTNLLKVMDGLLAGRKPEVAIIMIGTNDINGKKVPDRYKVDLDSIVQKCLAAHCIPILNTIPPRRGHQEAVREINGIIQKMAVKHRIPLVDFYAGCLERQPGEAWDGTLISKDGVHPSGGKTNIYTPENLKKSGYALRNWLNFLAFRQVYFHVLHPGKGG